MLALVPALCFLFAAESAAPPDIASILKQAAKAQAAGHTGEAARLYTQGVEAHPRWAEGWWSLAALLFDQQRFPEAETALQRFVGLVPNPWTAYALLGLCEYETRDYGAAEKHLAEWAAKKPPTSKELMADAFFHWALLLTRDRRFEPALVLLKSQARLGNRGPAMVEAMGLASLRIASVPEEYPPAEREPVWMAGRAKLETAFRQFDEAAANAKLLLLHYGAHPNVHYFIGLVLLEVQDNAGAAKEFERELEISPRHVPAMLQLALYDAEGGEAEKGLPLARRAVQLAPNDFTAHAGLGKVLLAAGRANDSIQELEIARRLAPDNPFVHWTLSQAYAAAGRHDDAARERAAFAKLSPRTADREAR